MVVARTDDDGGGPRKPEHARASGPHDGAAAGLQSRSERAAAEIELLAELAGAARVQDPVEVVALACRLLAELLGARRCTVVCDAGGQPSAILVSEQSQTKIRGTIPAAREPARDLGAIVEQVLRARGPRRVEWPAPGAAGPFPSGTLAGATGLAAPVGDRGVVVVEHDPGWECATGDVRLVCIVAAILGDVTRDLRRGQEEAHHEATSRAMRQLLETGVSARSPMEAAIALASTAARVLDVPVACAYLVDDAGRIAKVSTVGASPERAARLRGGLVGQLASDSPVWRRTVEGAEPGPDLIDDVTVGGAVRRGGVADLLGLRSLAAIPLLSSDGPLGLVLCGGPEPCPRWRAGTRDLLAQLALEGAVVVDNARLRAVERHEASHDALTGLLNRRAFLERLERALEDAGRNGSSVAVLLLDLDRFKEVNDYLGHLRGDELLVDVAERLRVSTRAGDVLARLGGDEFAFMLTTGASRRGAEVVAGKVAAVLEGPFELGEHVLYVDASVGVACYPEHASDATGLLQRADVAMYAAKRSGVGHEVYDPGVEGRAAEALGLLGDLRRALQSPSELRLHYQPKIDLRTGHVSGVEALVRWAHARHGLLGPDRFVPLAEETGLIRSLTAFVVPEALAQLGAWRSQGMELRVAVNVSARDVVDRDLPAKVASWLAGAGVDGRCLVVEVTERTVMDDRTTTANALQRLRELGVQVSLDDFGTGYSSLAYLESLPVDEIKIDRQFLRLGRSRRSVIRSIIALGHDLDMRVVAEGVETAEHAEWLTRMGCDEAQGYHFARPLPALELERWVASGDDEPGWLRSFAGD